MTEEPITDARVQCTELRLRLFRNGFEPLPNESKIPRLDNWSKVEITEEMIRSRHWSRHARHRDTGVRCGDVIAIDWDINDAKLLNDLLDLIVSQGIIPESDFVRIGKKPREMWIFRTSDKIGKRTTGFFAHPDAGPDDKPEQVEILGVGCQFAAYGMRDPATPYVWPVKSLVDYRYMDLPEITLEQVEKIKDFAILFFEERGLVRKSPEGGTDDGFTIVYDLTPEMAFDVKDHGVMSLRDLQSYFESRPDAKLRCRVDVLRPGTSGSLAGIVSLSNGEVCLSDFGSYTSHYPVSAGGEDDLMELGSLLANLQQSTVFERKPVVTENSACENLRMDQHGSYDDNFAIAMQRFSYVYETDTVADALENKTDMSMAAFRNFCAPFTRATEGKKGGTAVEYLAEQWNKDKKRRVVRMALMRPDKSYPYYEEGDTKYYNTYRPANLPTGGDASMGFDIIERLLPVAEERHYFLQWLSYKVQFPDTRGPGVIMVAHENYGTGRGSLIEMVKGIFAHNMVREIDFETLTGRGTQGQYNQWLADALIVAVNEAQEANAASKYQSRVSAYEHLKTIVDPGHHDIYVKRKGFDNYMGRTSASVIVMTNHMDSVILPSNDRRFAILENGKPQPQEYWARFHAWRQDKRNLGAFVEALKKYPLDGYNPFVAPPMTHSKADMIDAGESALDKAIITVMKAMPGSLLTREQLVIALEDYLADHSVEFPDEWKRSAERIYTRKTRKVLEREMIRVDGKMRLFRSLRDIPEGTFDSDDRLMAELLRNGPITRPLSASKSVTFG